ncbi:hypothetical protein M1105_05545 [Limibaculum sp. FT325]|uniref:hypothetical protein n=1 Tax=Thermohalobaculum sediminis TaxID=2939436 RepID=UPI0020C09F61|nr:hypothetical protein [Limibaculum sediminis]MCL5776450.1 hypothetical protein [Limibaculum sediminis]
MRTALSSGLIFLFATLVTPFAVAAERVEVCAEYESTGKKYRVMATIAKGSELNRATKSYSYTGFSTYVVIFWSQENASIIKMPFGPPSAFGSAGEDQEGRKWRVSTSTTFCF